MVCKKTSKAQLHLVLFFPRFLTCPCSRRIRLAGCGCIRFSFTLVFGLRSLFRFVLSNSRSSGCSASQLRVVLSGIFERLLELPSVWRMLISIRNAATEYTDNQRWQIGWPASRKWEDPPSSPLRLSRPNFCPSRYWAEASCRWRLDSKPVSFIWIHLNRDRAEGRRTQMVGAHFERLFAPHHKANLLCVFMLQQSCFACPSFLPFVPL